MFTGTNRKRRPTLAMGNSLYELGGSPVVLRENAHNGASNPKGIQQWDYVGALESAADDVPHINVTYATVEQKAS